MSGALRIGVLGCGDIVRRHALAAMGRVPEVEVVALASRDPEKAKSLAGRFGGTAVAGYTELLDRPDVDAVYVAVPTGLHHHWAGKALAAGKHVLCEKALAANSSEVADLVGKARERGLWLDENFTFPHHAQHAVVRDMIASGRIGAVRVFHAFYGIPPRPPGDVRNRADLGGGALLDVGCYVLRAARWFLGSELDVAGAVLRTDQELGIDVGGGALLRSAEGVTAELTFSFETSYRSGYTIWGDRGRLTVERAFITPPALRTVLRVDRQDHAEEILLPADDQFANSVRAFARAVTGGDDFHRQGRGLLGQAELLDRIRDLAETRPEARGGA